MKPIRRNALIAMVAFQILLLLGTIGKRLYLLRTGSVVHLSCRPVDPKSLLSGDYVELNYDISTFSRERLQKLNVSGAKFALNQRIFVALEKAANSRLWNAVAVAGKPGAVTGAGRVVLRGRVVKLARKSRGWSRQSGMRIRYGVEQYFVPQFEGLRIERRMAKVTVEVAVGSSGECAIKHLFIEDKQVVFY